MSTGPAAAAAGDPAVRTTVALGTSASVAVTDPAAADEALALLAGELAALDAACSRFRADSELRLLEDRRAGRATEVSPLLFEAVATACAVAAGTAGIVDPTVGAALVDLGYDRDLGELDRPAPGGAALPPSRPAPGWWRIGLDTGRSTVTVPEGVHVDLGSTGKAFAADRAAGRLARSLGCGVLVNLGGDVAVAGPGPGDGWGVGIAARCSAPAHEADEVVALHAGGLATSGTTARTWARGGRSVHHIVDPWTGEVAPRTWAFVSVVAATCVGANAWSTAAVVWGPDAPGNLTERGVAARLVAADGTVVRTGPWPGAPASPADAGAVRP